VFFSAIALLKFEMTVEGEVGGTKDALLDVGSSGLRVEKSEQEITIDDTAIINIWATIL